MKKGIRVVFFANLFRQTTGLVPETNWKTSTTRATKRRRWIYTRNAFYLIVKCLYENNRLIIVMRSEQ
jgi:hypothetical protein